MNARGSPPSDVVKIATRLGLPISPELRREAAEASHPPPNTGPAVPPHDESVVYPKVMECPACGARFAALTLRPRKDTPAARESDFHSRYTTPYNPYDYEVLVCPNDLYAALPTDFATLGDAYRPHVESTVDALVTGWGGTLPDFAADRTLDLRERSLELALALYTLRKLPRARLAAITHRLAWCARERGDPAVEASWLRQSLEHYAAAYEQTDLGSGKEELRVLYLCGELTLRLGDAERAAAWFSNALQHRRPGSSRHGRACCVTDW